MTSLLIFAQTWQPSWLPRDWRSLEFGRAQTRAEWALVLGAFALIVGFVWWMYRRDSVEISRPVGWLLALLRTAVFLGLLLIYLQPQWPNEDVRTENSRVLLLVDTSLSMRFPSQDSPSGPTGPSRYEALKESLADGKLLDELRKKHDVVVLSFDAEALDPRQVALLPKVPANEEVEAEQSEGEKPVTRPAPAFDEWITALEPAGNETRLGQSLKKLIYDERARPVAGIVVFSDFAHNAGIGPEVALQEAANAGIPLYTVGLGSAHLPANVSVELAAPDRAYPNDPYEVEALVQSQGLAGSTMKVELVSAPPGSTDPAAERVEGSEDVILGEDGSQVVAKFTLTAEEPGRRRLRVRVDAPAADRDAQDNSDEAEIEIVDRKTKVLLVAGGPTREYRFLRNQLYRGSDAEVDVLLQSAQPGVSQDAAKVLDEFPSTKTELYEYDCVVAFDPDWLAIGAERIALLADWVAKEAGGLIVVAGPVHTKRWTQHPSMDPIRALVPVEFHRSFTDLEELDEGEYGARDAAELEFTPEGAQAEFLWLDDSAASSRRAWDEFPGVYGFYAVRRPKPAATVYSWFTDPKGRPQEERVYFAGHYFGQGRVFYLASGEMWRLRALDTAYFERFYTKLIQHVTSGRLSRDSSRGELLVDASQYSLGATVSVTARLRNEQLDPLTAPSVTMEVVPPSKELISVQLEAAEEAPGIFRGQFVVREEGAYELLLDLGGGEYLRHPPLEVSLPDLERENHQRNDVLLKRLAQNNISDDAPTGEWYLSMASLTDGEGDRQPLPALLKDRTRTIVEPDAPTRFWDDPERARWALFVICGLLGFEWLIRRVSKLA